MIVDDPRFILYCFHPYTAKFSIVRILFQSITDLEITN